MAFVARNYATKVILNDPSYVEWQVKVYEMT